MTNREKELERALAGFERTGDSDLDSMVDAADEVARHLTVPSPPHPRGRALFIEGVAARKRSFMSSLGAPALGVTGLLIVIAVLGRSALPGESLYPVRKVLRSAGLASAPTMELEGQLDDAALLVQRAQTAFDRGSDDVDRFAGAALMSLGRCELYLNEVDAAERLTYEARIDNLSERALALISAAATSDDSSRGSNSGSSDDSSGRGSDDSGSDDNSGSGSDDSGSDDSGSDDSGSDDSGSDNSGKGSDDSGSGSDSSGKGSGDRADELEDRKDDAEDEQDDLRDEQEDLADEGADD